ILLLLAIALLSSCNLDNQGIFAEVIDRVPSDNRKLSFIGLDESDANNKIIYFKSVNGIESYNLTTGQYSKIDSSEDSKKNNVFVFSATDTDKEILYFVDKATSDSVSYEICYKLDIKDKDNVTITKLNNNSNLIFSGSYNQYLIDKEGKVYSYSITDTTITFDKKAEVSSEYYVKNIDDIFAFSTKKSDAKASDLKYYKFDGNNFNPISLPEGTSNIGFLRSVTSDGTYQYLIFSEVNGTAETSAFKLNGTKLTKESKLSSTKVGKDFKSFVAGNNLYFAYDGSTSFNTLTLGENPALTSNTISKLGNVAIVGYFKVNDNVNNNDYIICTANNGFLTLSLDGTPHLK
ncbi:hypothetical protein, partial [Bullifex sp.]|uniref:hypothetical protein n=1 Tax=Bullifex sp. TaxID=2815808 RepID=UPI002A827C1E